MDVGEQVRKLGWASIGLALKLLYGYRFEGAENFPEEGPFILVIKEGGGPLSMFSVAISYIQAAVPMMGALRDNFVATMHEDLWVKFFSRYPVEMAVHPFRPHSAGVLAFGMLDQLRALREGGVTIINPEGDLSWDGRPLPIRPGTAWLGLHTAAPLVPISCSSGAYDSWPLWQRRPNLRGRLVVRMGRPFRLCDSPMERVTPEDLEEANARIEAELNKLYYGEGGTDKWAGQPLRDGEPLETPVSLQPVSPVEAREGFQGEKRNWGVPLLLWQCPICYTNDALVHRRPWFRRQSLDCQACSTKWHVERVPTRDFRLKVVDGNPELVGLDMPLSTWYDEMKAGFRLSPIPAHDVELPEDEQLLLRADGVELLPYEPSTLLEEWTSGEAPHTQPGGQAPAPSWASLGTGELIVTNNRLRWQGPQGYIDFQWPTVRAVSLPWQGTLGITYGSALYRFDLGPEAARKWLTYAGTLAQEAAEQAGHTITLSPF